MKMGNDSRIAASHLTLDNSSFHFQSFVEDIFA